MDFIYEVHNFFNILLDIKIFLYMEKKILKKYEYLNNIRIHNIIFE